MVTSPYQKIGVYLVLVLITTIIACKKNDPPQDQPEDNYSIVFNSDRTYGSVTDIDGNVYKTIEIGNQTWMAENLRVTRYSNGDPFETELMGMVYPQGYLGSSDYEGEDNLTTYGRLYNVSAYYNVDEDVCPTGWHVPSADEWRELIDYLGGETIAGGKMKEVGTTHWYNDSEATNESGFTALPGGQKTSEHSQCKGCFYNIHSRGYWLTSSVSAMVTIGANNNAEIWGSSWDYGLSVRCVKD